MKSFLLLVLLCCLGSAINSLVTSIFKNSWRRGCLRMSANDDLILRKVDKWACIKNCGACCKLGPLDSRPDLSTYLSPEELDTYKSLIGPDDWCINFDQTNRLCKIYDTRPNFCRVDGEKYEKMYDIKADELSDFCGFCCTEHIRDVYGEDSDEMERFEDVFASLDQDP